MRFKRLLPLILVASLFLTFYSAIVQIEPVRASTLTYQVSLGTDDCWKGWTGSSWAFYTWEKMDNEAGYWNTGDYKEGGGMRFQNIAIPQGATIISAYLQFWYGSYGIDLTNPYCHNKIRGEDADTSETFSTVGDFDGRTRTTAEVDWTYIEAWYQNNWYNSPDLSAIIQEIVDRPGWSTGNNLTLFRDDFDDRSAHIDFTSRICYAYERGAATAPKLVITYDSGSGDSGTYLYQIYGPYRENGDVYDGIANITLSFAESEPLYYMVNGSDGSADTLEIYTNESAVSMFWNVSSDHTWQRTYRFSNSTLLNTVYLYVPDSTLDVAITQYQIGVTDFAGLTNAYVETTKNVGGYVRIIERRSLDVLNNIPFWLIPFTQYNLRISSAEGTWTFDLLADGVTTKQYVITKDMITQQFTGTNITVTATRINTTCIAITYSDPLLLTENITSQILHRNSSATTGYTEDFSQVDSTYVTSIEWNEGAGNMDYIANITAYRDGESLFWSFSLPIPTTDVVQFFTGYFDLFGVFPIPSYQLPAVFLCLLFFGIGSYRDSDILSAITIVICGMLTIIGWGSFPVAGMATALMVVVFMYLHKGKQDTVIFE